VLPGNGNIVPVAESTRDAIKVAIEPYQLCDLELWSAPSGRPDLPDSGLGKASMVPYHPQELPT